jgi:hypothetical protein
MNATGVEDWMSPKDCLGIKEERKSPAATGNRTPTPRACAQEPSSCSVTMSFELRRFPEKKDFRQLNLLC